jgi:hypothetical protein
MMSSIRYAIKGIFDYVLEGHMDFDSDPWTNVSEKYKES